MRREHGRIEHRCSSRACGLSTSGTECFSVGVGDVPLREEQWKRSGWIGIICGIPAKAGWFRDHGEDSVHQHR
jgi:hypothetical protein